MDTDCQELMVDSGAAAGGGRWARLARRRLPILRWGPRYSRLAAVADLVAGLTLGLTLVPQSIAYAALADLPVQYGLYSAFVGTIMYMFLGTVKEVSIGPTSLMALFTLTTCRGLPIEFVVLLTFLSGLLVMLMGMLRLGFLVEFISPSVTSGFTSGTAVIIVASQLKGLLGLSFVAETVPENLGMIARSLDRVRFTDLALSVICCTVLLLLRKLKDVRVSPKRPGLKKTLWLISIGRNALVVCVASVVAFCLHNPEKPLFKLSGRVEPGLPPLSLPPFSVTMGNETMNFFEMAQRLTPGLYMLPVIMVLANIAIAKAFTAGGRVDATQEMLTLGLCNLLGSLVHAMPCCGAFTRSAVSQSSGVRTPAAGLYSGIITLLALNFMTQYFYFIPKACLSSVLICAVIFMVDYQIVGRLWSVDKCELVVVVATFAVSVAWSVEAALLAGALASLALFLRDVARPTSHTNTEKVGCTEVTVILMPSVLVYINAEQWSAGIMKHVGQRAGQAAARSVALDAHMLSTMDYTANQVIERLIKKCKAIEVPLIFFNGSPESVRRLENIPGINKQALLCRDVTDALLVNDVVGGDETTTLLTKEQKNGSSV